VREVEWVAFDQNQYINDWKRQNREKICAELPKGKRQLVKDCAKKKGMSVSRFIVEALENYYHIDLSN